jgi:hypothetical protein
MSNTESNHVNKGKLFTDLRPRKCSNCPEQVPLGRRGLYLDARTHTENGWLPYVNEVDNQHWYFIFCSVGCLKSFIDRTVIKGEEMGLI